jgi:type I restriction-modification system DNA methylase subunit
MSTISKEQAKKIVADLVAAFRQIEQPDLESESNVRANFIDPLFAALGWPVNEPRHYNREEFVRGVGFADIALSVDASAETPLIFVEAKRFGMIEPLARVQDRRNRDVAQLKLQLPGMSVDRTREEQQAINYAYQKGMRWAVLTNFEHFRLFNARRDTLVLSFDSPGQLLERFDELWQLAFTEVRQGSLEGLRAHRERADVDEEYLRLINVWRLRLGQDILAHRENLILLEDHETRAIDVYKLREAVQRILDRLVVIRFAEDRLVIKADQLRAIVEISQRTDYGFPILDQIRYFFQEFNVRHNGALFADHLCDRLSVNEDVLQAIIVNLYDARFRSMSADIMGNTYEQYLGQTLAVENGSVRTVVNVETRKAQGSYYTPEYVVRYIIDQTLGRYLYGTENGRSDGTPIPGQQRKRLHEIDGTNGDLPLTILDPACGSGSFLMYAYQVLENFYLAEIKEIEREREEQYQTLFAQGVSGIDLQIALADSKRRLDHLADFRNQILERHLYGVDLDPQAAELAAVNLMLRAMTRDMRLPLILNQNVKVGNSLLGGLPVDNGTTAELLAPLSTELAELRRIRLAQQGMAQDPEHPIRLQGQFERLAGRVNAQLNEQLTAYFGEEVAAKRPFNWVIEFPELFIDENGRLRLNGGFTFVLGNPPYLSIDDTWGQNAPEAAYLRDAFADIWAGKSDVYYYLLRRGISLLRPAGQLGFITARYYLEAYYASKLRQAMLQETVIRQIVDFGDATVFVGVGTKTAITLLQRQPEEQVRSQNSFLFAKIADKRQDVAAFLTQFRQMAHVLRQADLDGDSWNLYGEAVARLIAKIDHESQLLGDLTFIGQGMQTGRNPVFVIDKATRDRYQIESELLRKNVKNQDIGRYNLAFRGLYLIYPEEIDNLDDYPRTKAYLTEHRSTLEERAAFKRGDCDWWRFTWPLHKERYSEPKLMTPYIAPENRFALDWQAEFIGLTDTTAIFATTESPDLRYLLALLNSRLLTFRYRYIGKAKDYRYEYFENGLKKIPIRLAPADAQQTIINLAQQLLDLNYLRQTLYQEFQEIVQATSHTLRDFYGAYYDHSEYRPAFMQRVGTADAQTRGTVTAIQVRTVGEQLHIHITDESGAELPLISLQVADDDLRYFLLLSLRTYLLANQRKQIWARSRLLDGALKAVNVPVFEGATAAANMARIHQVTAELRQRVTDPLDDQLLARLNLSDPLDMGAIEIQMAATEQKIDQLVFTLYGVDRLEEIRLIEQMLR